MQVKHPESPEFIHFKGDMLTISAAKPLPPGSRVAFFLSFNEDAPIPVQAKVVYADTMADDPTKIRLTLRVHSLPKGDRDRLCAASA